MLIIALVLAIPTAIPRATAIIAAVRRVPPALRVWGLTFLLLPPFWSPSPKTSSGAHPYANPPC